MAKTSQFENIIITLHGKEPLEIQETITFPSVAGAVSA